MPLSNHYYTSFTGGAPYELGAVEHQYDQEDEEEKLRREMELATQQSRLNSYANSTKQMEQERAMRLGYGTLQQQLADPYSQFYSWQQAPAGTTPVNIGMHEDNGAVTEQLFRPRVRAIAPDADEKISMFREATRSGSSLTGDEYQDRIDAKTRGQIEAAAEKERLIRDRKDRETKQGIFGKSASIQASADGADKLQIAREYETSATAAMAPQAGGMNVDQLAAEGPVAGAAAGANPEPVTDAVAKPPPAANPKAQAAQREADIQEAFTRYRKRGFSDEQIRASLKKKGLM